MTDVDDLKAELMSFPEIRAEPEYLEATRQFNAAIEKIWATAKQHEGLWQAVLTILDDTVKSDVAEEMLVAMQPVITQMQEIAALDRWLEHVPTNLAEEEIQRTSKARRVKKRDDLIKTLLDQAAGIIKARSTETRIERNRRYYQRMCELISGGAAHRAAAQQVYKEEIAAGRSPPSDERIRDLYYELKEGNGPGGR